MKNLFLQLNDLLIKPLQRITRYELLIRDILKHTNRAGLTIEAQSLEKSLKIIRKVLKSINDLMVTRRMRNCEDKIPKQDTLLIYGTLKVIECNSDRRKASTMQRVQKLEVFMFDRVLIFTEIVGKKTQYTDPSYDYKSHIPVNMMSIEEIDNFGKKRFLIKSTDSQKSMSYICISEDKHNEWIEIITSQLEGLHDLGKMLENPLRFMEIGGRVSM